MNEKKGAAEVFLGSALWGSIGVFVLLLARMGSTSALSAFLRMGFAFAILFAVTLVKSGWRAFLLPRQSFLAAVLLGFVCQGLFNYFYNEAVMDLGMTLGAVMLNLAPACTMLASRALFGETFTARKTAAMALCVMGCVLTVTGGNLAFAGFSLTGLLFGLGSGVTYGLTSVFGKWAGRCDVWAMSCWSYCFGSLFLLITTHPFSGATLSGGLLFTGFLYALIPTALAYIFYYKGVQRIRDNSVVPVIASMETVVAALFGVFLFHESLGAVNLLGMGVILFSIVLMSGKLPSPMHVSRETLPIFPGKN